jgi:glucokinase
MHSPLEILVADIGGTSSRFASYRIESGNRYRLLHSQAFATADFPSFEHLLAQVGADHARLRLNQHAVAVFGVPGPVLESTEARLTNVPWDMNVSTLNTDATRVFLINDFEAQAFGCLAAQAGDFIAVKHANKTMTRGLAVVGAGTGVGHCAIKMQDGRAIAIPSEAGQIPFPFQGQREMAFLDFVTRETGDALPNGDRIVSGQGFSLVHQFLTGEALSPAQAAAAARTAPDSETCRWFSRFYARQCRNYCLSLLPVVDTLFVSGGVASKNPFLVDNRHFLEEFVGGTTKARELDAIAIRLARTESLGLLGAAHYGALKLSESASGKAAG